MDVADVLSCHGATAIAVDGWLWCLVFVIGILVLFLSNLPLKFFDRNTWREKLLGR